MTKTFKCDICDFSSSLKAYMKRHIVSVNERKKPFKCNFCDYSFSQKAHMKRHIASVHEEKKPFKCDICDSCLSLKRNIWTNTLPQFMKKRSHWNSGLILFRYDGNNRLKIPPCYKKFVSSSYFVKEKLTHKLTLRAPFATELRKGSLSIEYSI